MFPSPLGIFFISIVKNNAYIEGKRVSVPYGDLFYFYDYVRAYNTLSRFVSVPYGDLFYFYELIDKDLLKDESFPSPTGIFFISIE